MFPLANELSEVRLHGLSKSITAEALGEFLGKGVRVRGLLLHPLPQGSFQWAQAWVATEEEVNILLGLREALAANGITIARPSTPRNASTPPYTPWDLMSQLAGSSRLSGVAVSSAFNNSAARFDPGLPHPRNLYVLSLPLDLTQSEFRDLFLPFGRVDHSVLLSQLDGMGRRRGFVLMASHAEAVEVLTQMHGKWIDGNKLDVSWALVQREGRATLSNSLHNRVIHPPAVSLRREPTPDCLVVVENLDPQLFPDTETISQIFKSFGPISRVIKLSETPTSALIQFDSAGPAAALVAANGLRLGTRMLSTRAFSSPSRGPPSPELPAASPFPDFATTFWHRSDSKDFEPSTRLSADSQPFVPTKVSTTPVMGLAPPSGGIKLTPVKSAPIKITRPSPDMKMQSDRP